MMNAISIGFFIQFSLRILTADRVYTIVGCAEVGWKDATQYCLEQVYDHYDFTLASIETDDDYEALKDLKDVVKPKKYRIRDNVPFWVGLYRHPLGEFLWADGTPCETDDGLCVSDWLETPNLAVDDGKYCVTLTVDKTDGSKGYKAEDCDTEYRYICSFMNGTTLAPLHDEDAAIGSCAGGDTYSIAGRYCVVTGPGHTFTWNGARHNYQGNPDLGYENFYYVAPCYDASTADLPFTVIGHRYLLKWWDTKMTGLDYITLELFQDSYDSQKRYDKYYLWMSSGIQAYIAATDVDDASQRDNPSYDYHKSDADLVTLAADDFREIGNDGKFQVKYIKSGNYIQAWLKIDGVEQVYFRMYAQWIELDGRYRMHAFILDPPANYRCFICGLCGDFKRQLVGSAYAEQTLITCDGGLIDYQYGWTKSHPGWEFAYDLNGNSWGYEYVDEQCPLYDVEGRESAAYQIEQFVDEIGYQPLPNGDVNDSGVVIEITSTWIAIAGLLLLLLLLTISCGYICYLNVSTPQRGKRGYSAVKYIESDYGDSEAPMVQQQIQ